MLEVVVLLPRDDAAFSSIGLCSLLIQYGCFDIVHVIYEFVILVVSMRSIYLMTSSSRHGLMKVLLLLVNIVLLEDVKLMLEIFLVLSLKCSIIIIDKDCLIPVLLCIVFGQVIQSPPDRELLELLWCLKRFQISVCCLENGSAPGV